MNVQPRAHEAEEIISFNSNVFRIAADLFQASPQQVCKQLAFEVSGHVGELGKAGGDNLCLQLTICSEFAGLAGMHHLRQMPTRPSSNDTTSLCQL